MKSLLWLLLTVLLTNSFLFSQTKQPIENPYPKFVPYAVKQNTSEQQITNLDLKNLGKEQPARWMSVDPLADQYPGWSPYNYTLNNPLIYVDPNGMWTANYDEKGNAISAVYEDGDTYEDLYTQLGISAEDFSGKYGIDLSSGITTKTFDITSYAIANQIFQSSNTNSNCFGFAITAIGKSTTESQAQGVDFLSSIGNPSSTNNPQTGDLTVWSYTGNISGSKSEGLEPIQGTPAHTGIFILNNQAGQSQFLNRMTLGAPVSINTNSDINKTYSSLVTRAKEYGFNLPGISSAVFYKVK
ncbi:MAG TPA: hypothetical protein VLH59_10250 [Ignavibacteriaceae bacterium]|nr:hypothetical protein [Ignavibacteriaceae bacterium]